MLLPLLMNLDMFGGVVPPPTPEPSVSETPAGRRTRRSERFIARFRDQEYLFDSPDELEAFIESVRTPAQKRRGKRPAVKIVVPQAIETELSHFDLPSIRRQLERYQWQSAIETWKRYESIKGSFAESEGQIAMIFAQQLEMEDEELLLL